MDANVTGSVSGQMNFGGDGSIVTVTTKQFTGVNIVDITVDNVVYHVYAPQPDSIVISDLLTEGTKIGRININGVNYDIYAPTDGSGSDVSVIPLLDHGTEIASITVDGETAHIFAPTPQTVSATAQYDTGVLVGNINIGGNITYFYIPDYGADITALDNRLDTAEDNITGLDGRLDTAEDNITGLDGRLDTAEDNITGLTTRMGAAEGNITGLTNRMGAAEGNITGLTNRMGAAEGNITNLSGRMTEAETDITALGIECDAIAADLAAPYDEDETYSVGDYCTHDKVLYICTTDISTAEEWDISHWDAVKVCDDITEIKSSLSDLENITVGTPRKVGKWGNYDRYEVWLEGTTPTMTANTWTQIKSYTFNTASIIEKVFTISDSGGLIFNDYYTSTTSYLTSYIKSDGIYLRVGNAAAFTGQKFYCKVTYVS